MNISPARTAAFEILQKIELKRAFSSDLLPQYEKTLSIKDRGLCHELTLGVLRRQIYLDRIISQFSDDKKLDNAVRISVRIGLYQLLFLDKIPAHAAINESVELVARAKKRSAKGFVNAILRQATRKKIAFDYVDEIERLSVETSHPRWLIERWIGEFGSDETIKIARSNNTIPPITFRVTSNYSLPADSGVRRSAFVEGCWITDGMDEELLRRAENGEIYFQDEASQMVADSIKLNDDESFLDVCAAPGGKTTMIAKYARNHKTLIAAGDLHWQRVKFLRKNCAKQLAGFVNIIQYDAEKGLPFPDAYFDLILIDAPCSGTGTIRHNPEIRYFLTPNDFDKLPAKQLNILRNASKSVKKRGTIVYSTCSLEREENEMVCERFLSESPDFEKIPSGLPEIFETHDGFARTFPHRDNMDGFFVARFCRSRL